MVHKGSKETLDFIADWIDPAFFFSRKDVWHRMGILGVFGDYVLQCTQGSIMEIGCGESSIYLSNLARKYDRRIFHCDIAPDKIINPLSVPGYMLPFAIDDIDSKKKILECNKSLFYMGPSDDFFKDVDPKGLCLSFIDGDHNYRQAKIDFENVLERTVDNGYILLHDTYPPSKEYLCPDSKCGDVYRLRIDFKRDPRVDVITLPVGTAMGVGITICRKVPANREYFHA